MKNLEFYKCNKCGNVIVKLVNSGINVFCCGTEMEKLNAKNLDGAVEKHLPKIKIENNVVNINVGEVQHPMTAEHYIQFIVLQTDKNIYVKYLSPEDLPEACFATCKNEKAIAVYSYCNLHGLWETVIK